MRLLTGKEMSAYDQATFAKLGVPSRVIMENAGRAVGGIIIDRYQKSLTKGVLILAGFGNNAGDGLVVARMFKQLNIPVKVAIFQSVEELKANKKSPDLVANFLSYESIGGEIVDLNIYTDIFKTQCGIIIDAIFGTGFKGSTSGIVEKTIIDLNEYSKNNSVPVIAVDIASGVEADGGGVNGEAVRANLTVALQELKVGHIISPGVEHTGDIICVDIGVKTDFLDIESEHRELLEQDSISELAKKYFLENAESHKGKRGHILVIGGSSGHFGAPILSSEAAISSGAGLVTCIVPESGVFESLNKAPYLMIQGMSESEGGFSGADVCKLSELVSNKSAVIIGPGLGKKEGSRKILKATLEILKNKNIPVVIDADALNILSENQELFNLLPKNIILTPHPGEMSRILKISIDEVQKNRINHAVALARKINNIIVLKGARTIVTDGRAVAINPFASPILGTAGSGDVLCGIIASCLARGVDKFSSAKFGVFVHGLSGAVIEKNKGGTIGGNASLIASTCSDVINNLCDERTRKIQLYKEVFLS